MKAKRIIDETTNRGDFNRAYKSYLAQTGKIRCGYCKYNRSCNNPSHYGGYEDDKNGLRYPSWKLVSKNRKQWMEKPLKKTTRTIMRNSSDYITFKWK